MPRPWQRIASCIAAAVLALLLSGCEVRGTVDVRSGTEAVADLVFTEAQVDCYGLTRYAGLVIKGTPESDGHQTCRAQGTIDPEALKDFGIQLTQAGEYVIVELQLPTQIGFMPIQVDIGFPGTVVDSGGLTVTGNSVRLGNASGLSDGNPIRLVAQSHPGPQWWVLALLGGLIGGVALTLAGVLLLRRRRLRTEVNPVGDEDADAEPTVTLDTEPARDPGYEALFAPPPPDTEVAQPPAPAASPPDPPVAVAADHTIWAPPDDRGDR